MSHADDQEILPSAIAPRSTVTLKGPISSWRERASQWYKSDDLKSRRRQMRQMSKPLKRPCYYCHTRNFKDYIDSTYLISLQMMAISSEQDLKCADCHIGKRGLTVLGAKSLIQWRYAADQGRECSDCHQDKGHFKRLNERGERSREELISWLDQHGSKLKLPSQTISAFKQQLSIKKSLNEDIPANLGSPHLPNKDKSPPTHRQR